MSSNDIKFGFPAIMCLALGTFAPVLSLAGASASNPVQEGEMAGYLLVPNQRAPKTYNAGFSLYVAAWPLLKEYPGHNFQSGLFGTWMFAQYDGQAPTNLYSDIEGGLGWWRDTRFATETPKFIMGGVAPNFIEWANGPGAGKGRDWKDPKGHYGIAQLQSLAALASGWPEPQTRHVRRTVRLRVSASAAHSCQTGHCRAERADGKQLLDLVLEYAQFQRPGGVLHAIFLVARSAYRTAAGGLAPG